MDDLQITISLTELMTLIESAKRVPEAEKSLVSLSRRLDGLFTCILKLSHSYNFHKNTSFSK